MILADICNLFAVMIVVNVGSDTSGQSHIEQRIQAASLLSSSGQETTLDITGLTMLSFRGALLSKLFSLLLNY